MGAAMRSTPAVRHGGRVRQPRTATPPRPANPTDPPPWGSDSRGGWAHWQVRRGARAMAHAKGTTSMPLAAHQTKPPKARTIAPAPIAAVLPASLSVRRRASYASPASAAKDRTQHGQRMASPRAPRSQNGASTAGHSTLVAPLDGGAPAWNRSGWPSAMARAYWKWMYASSSVAARGPPLS